MELSIKTLLLDSDKEKKTKYSFECYLIVGPYDPDFGTEYFNNNRKRLPRVNKAVGHSGTIIAEWKNRLMSALSADIFSVLLNKAFQEILMISFSVLFRFQLSSGVKSGNKHIHFLKVEVEWTIYVYNMTANVKNI